MSEWTPAGVLKIFENRSGAGVDFFKEGPEWSRSQFFNKRLLCLLLIIIIAGCFLQSMLLHHLQMCSTTSQEVLIKTDPESLFHFGSSRSLCGHFLGKHMGKLRLDGLL